MSRYVVIGGGIVGASAAYHLAKRGAETVLVDRRDVGHATAAGAGIISAGGTSHVDDAYFALAKPAIAYYPELVAALGDLGQTNTGYDVVGELYLAETDEQAAELDNVYATIAARRDAGVPNIGQLSWMDQQQARDAFPAIGTVVRAIHFDEAARVDGRLMREALVAGAEHHGARVVVGDAELILDGDRVIGVQVDGERIEADGVVIATGAWTNALIAPLGGSLPVAPQKGQIVHITLGETDTSRWPILTWFGDQYILTFGPNRVVAGATRETGSGFDTRLTPGGVQHVLDTALRIAPGLANGTLHEVRIGLRPFSADGLPFVGRFPGHDEVVVVTGHGPSGLTMGPYSGKVGAELLLGEEPLLDLRPYAVSRALGAPAAD